MDKKKPEDFYLRLKEQLTETSLWPSKYLYKFIVPSDKDKIASIIAIFKDIKAEVDSRQSKKGTYTSISIATTMKNPDAVIAKYKEVDKIDGVISL